MIPDRRSYESINTQLAMQGHNLRMSQALQKEHRGAAGGQNIHAYILEDYPPPPYQPPRGVHTMPNGAIHQRQISANAVLQNGNITTRVPMSNGQLAPGTRVPMSNGQLVPGARFVPAVFRNNGERLLATTQSQTMDQGTSSNRLSTVEHAQGRDQGHIELQLHPSPNRQSNPDCLQTVNRQAQSNPDLLPVIARQSLTHMSPPTNVPMSVSSRPDITSSLSPSHQTSVSSPGQSSNFVRHIGNSKLGSQPNPQSTPQNIQLQTYGRQSLGNNNNNNNNNPSGQNMQQSPTGSQLPNGNVAKLLHDAYRIQQFETTA